MTRPLSTLRLNDPKYWDAQISALRLPFSGVNALRILVQAQGVVPVWKYHTLQLRLLPSVNHHFHTDLPRSLLLKIPCITPPDARSIKRSFCHFMHSTTLPKPIKQYLSQSLIVPISHPRKLLHVFTRDRLQSSIHEYQQYVDAHADQDNCILTGPQLASSAPDSLTTLLRAPLNKTVTPTPFSAHYTIAEQLQRIRDQLPKAAPFPFKDFAAHVHNVFNTHLRSHRVKQACISANHLRLFTESYLDCLPVRVDKYPLLFVVATVVTFSRLVLQAMLHSPNYRLIMTAKSNTRARHTLLLYYFFCARLYPELVNGLSPMRQRNNLSLHIPTLKGISIPMPTVPFPLRPVQPTNLLRLKHILLHHAEVILRHTDNILYIPPSKPYPQRRIRSVYPPLGVISVKGKSLPYSPPTPLKKVATREIFTNGAHPWKPYCRTVARAASTACQIFQSSFFTLQVLNQKQFVSQFLIPARDYFAFVNIDVAGLELDLERMFPSLKRQKLQPAYSTLIDRIQKMYCHYRTDKNLYISIAKGSEKTLDTVGKKSDKYYRVFDGTQLVDCLTLEGYLNDLFQVGTGIHEQFTGVSIGGTAAAQNPNTILMCDESTINWDSKLPPHTKLCRYVDNVVCLCPKAHLLHTALFVKRLLHRIYAVPLTLEQLGTNLTILQVHILCNGPHIHWALKNKVLLSYLTPRIPVTRYPHTADLNAQRTVHGMSKNLTLLANQLQTQPLLFVSNCSHIVWEFLQKRYPTSWWLSVIKRSYTQFPATLPPWDVFLKTLPWTLPYPPKYCMFNAADPAVQMSLTTTPSFQFVQSCLPPLTPISVVETMIEKTAIASFVPAHLWFSYIFPFLPSRNLLCFFATARSTVERFWFAMPISLSHTLSTMLYALASHLHLSTSMATLRTFFLAYSRLHRTTKRLAFPAALHPLLQQIAFLAVSPHVESHKTPQGIPPLGGRGRHRAAKRCRFIDTQTSSHRKRQESLLLLQEMVEHLLPKRRCTRK